MKRKTRPVCPPGIIDPEPLFPPASDRHTVYRRDRSRRRFFQQHIAAVLQRRKRHGFVEFDPGRNAHQIRADLRIHFLLRRINFDPLRPQFFRDLRIFRRIPDHCRRKFEFPRFCQPGEMRQIVCRPAVDSDDCRPKHDFRTPVWFGYRRPAVLSDTPRWFQMFLPDWPRRRIRPGSNR